MNQRVILILLCLLIFGSAKASLEDMKQLVMVASTDSKISSLTKKQIRKAFLGFPVMSNEHTIEPLINNTDPILHEVFLQKLIFISSKSYQRRMISKVFTYGGKRPSTAADTRTLIDKLNKNPDSITYMWADVARSTPGIKIINEIWQGSIE